MFTQVTHHLRQIEGTKFELTLTLTDRDIARYVAAAKAKGIILGDDDYQKIDGDYAFRERERPTLDAGEDARITRVKNLLAAAFAETKIGFALRRDRIGAFEETAPIKSARWTGARRILGGTTYTITGDLDFGGADAAMQDEKGARSAVADVFLQKVEPLFAPAPQPA